MRSKGKNYPKTDIRATTEVFEVASGHRYIAMAVNIVKIIITFNDPNLFARKYVKIRPKIAIPWQIATKEYANDEGNPTAVA